MQNSVELQEWFFVKRNAIEVAYVDAPFAQAVTHGLVWKIRIVLFAREPFLLCGGDDFSIAHETCRAIVIKSGQAQNVHDSDSIRTFSLMGGKVSWRG